MKDETVFIDELDEHKEKVALETEIATLELAIKCLENIKQDAKKKLEGIKTITEKSQINDLIDVVICNGRLYHRHPITHVFDMGEILRDAMAAVYMEGEDNLALPILGAVWTDTGLTFVAKYENAEWKPIQENV